MRVMFENAYKNPHGSIRRAAAVAVNRVVRSRSRSPVAESIRIPCSFLFRITFGPTVLRVLPPCVALPTTPGRAADAAVRPFYSFRHVIQYHVPSGAAVAKFGWQRVCGRRVAGGASSQALFSRRRIEFWRETTQRRTAAAAADGAAADGAAADDEAEKDAGRRPSRRPQSRGGGGGEGDRGPAAWQSRAVPADSDVDTANPVFGEGWCSREAGKNVEPRVDGADAKAWPATETWTSVVRPSSERTLVAVFFVRAAPSANSVGSGACCCCCADETSNGTVLFLHG